jgi:dTDP-glucose 4,6-dehydratase
MGKSSKNIEFVNDRPGHDFRYSLDSLKIQKELNWSPSLDFDKNLKETIEWYIENMKLLQNTSKKALTKIGWKS